MNRKLNQLPVQIYGIWKFLLTSIVPIFQARRQNGRGGLSYVAEGYNSDDEVYATDKCAFASLGDM